MGAVSIVAARRVLVAAAAAAIALASLGVPLVAASEFEVTFGPLTASSVFGKSLSFSQPIGVTTSTVTRTELLLQFPGALGPNLNEVPVSAPLGTGGHVLKFTWDTAKDGHIVPNTLIVASWRVTMADGTVAEGPRLQYRYRDDTFDWRTKDGDLVSIHWYQGDASFGTRALAIAETGVANAEKLLGVTEKDPIDFYVYADQAAFYAALGPGTPENVGGEAHADIRTMFALITPGQVDQAWVKEVVPHELTHLVFNTAVDNPYHAPPRWLNEGLAVYLSRGLHLERPVAGRGRRQRGHARATGQPWWRLPQWRPVLPRVRGERLGGRLHGEDLREAGSRQAHPLVRAGADRRRGVQGGARCGRCGVRRRLAQGPRRQADGQHRTASRPGRSAAVRLDRPRPGRRLRAACGEPRRFGFIGRGRGDGSAIAIGFGRVGWPGRSRVHAARNDHRRRGPGCAGARGRRGDLRRLP